MLRDEHTGTPVSNLVSWWLSNRHKNSSIVFGLNHLQWCDFLYMYAWFLVYLFNPDFRGCQNPINGLSVGDTAPQQRDTCRVHWRFIKPAAVVTIPVTNLGQRRVLGSRVAHRRNSNEFAASAADVRHVGAVFLCAVWLDRPCAERQCSCVNVATNTSQSTVSRNVTLSGAHGARAEVRSVPSITGVTNYWLRKSISTTSWKLVADIRRSK